MDLNACKILSKFRCFCLFLQLLGGCEQLIYSVTVKLFTDSSIFGECKKRLVMVLFANETLFPRTSS